MSIRQTKITFGMIEAAFRLIEALKEDPSPESRALHLDAYCANAEIDPQHRMAVSDLADLFLNRDRIILEQTLAKIRDDGR